MGDEDPADVEAAANDYEELRKKAYNIGEFTQPVWASDQV